MPKKDGGLILKGEQLLENMILFTHIHVGTNSDDCISSSINVEVSQYQQNLPLNPRVEDLNARDLSLVAVAKGSWIAWGKSTLVVSFLTASTGSRG